MWNAETDGVPAGFWMYPVFRVPFGVQCLYSAYLRNNALESRQLQLYVKTLVCSSQSHKLSGRSIANSQRTSGGADVDSSRAAMKHPVVFWRAPKPPR
jgi:hypothetical protein